MNSITEISSEVLDVVAGGAFPFSSTISIGANGSVTGSYTFNGSSGSFSTTIPYVYKPVSVSVSGTSVSVSA
jgi:hypothetical protein